MSDKTYFYEWECDEKHKKPNKCFICDVVGVKWTWLQNTPYIEGNIHVLYVTIVQMVTKVGQTMKLCMDLVYERSELSSNTI